MDAKDAVRKSIEYVSDVFESEHPDNLGLEEVVFNGQQNVWEVTVGFSRPWDYPKGGLVTGLQPQAPRRQYKIVQIDNISGDVISIKIRELKNA
jgi:hypothetical protein